MTFTASNHGNHIIEIKLSHFVTLGIPYESTKPIYEVTEEVHGLFTLNKLRFPMILNGERGSLSVNRLYTGQ